MTDKTESERLADAIDPFVRKAAPDHLTSKVAADELRRLESLFEAAKAVGIRQEQSIIDLEAEVERLTAALAAERERCARVCEDQDTGQGLPHDIAVIECAAAIRAEAKGE